jgi:DnaK suppressor protein
LPQRKRTSKSKQGRSTKTSPKSSGRSARKAGRKATRKTKATSKTKGTSRTKTARKATAKTKTARKPKTAKRAVKKGSGKTVAKRKRGASRAVAKKAAAKRQSRPRQTGTGVVKAAKIRSIHSKSRIEELRTMLEAKRAEILQEIKRAREDSVDANRTSFAEVGDLVSASVEKEKAFEYGEAGVNALREIDSALEKLKSGTYGICEVCSKVISVKRLRIMPSARLCIKCKSAEEASGGNPLGR